MKNEPISIVGGGPAGCSAAVFLARRGFDVNLYERNEKTSKTCAGGLSWRVIREFKSFLEGLELLPIKDVCFDIEGEEFEINFKDYIGHVVDRPSFDKHLRDISKGEGVKIINKNVLSLPNNGLVIDARGFKKPNDIAIAIRGFCKTEKHEKMFFMFKKDMVKLGYFWIFPMNENMVNVGVGGFAKTFKTSPSLLLKWFCKKKELQPYDISSAPIYLEGKIENLVGGNVIRVGESAGLVNPLTAEGIYYALKSGKIAAECIFKNKIQDYEKLIKREFEKEFEISKALRYCLSAPTKIKKQIFKIGLWCFKKTNEGLSSSLV